MKKYWSIFITQIINNLAYPGELFWRSLAILLFMWIFSSLWRVTYSVTDAEGMTGLSLRDTMWYFMLAEVIELSKPRLSAAISSAVKDGSIAYLLNKPFNFLLYQFSSGMGDSIVRALMNILIGSIAVWLLAGPPPGLLGWLFAAVLIMNKTSCVLIDADRCWNASDPGVLSFSIRASRVNLADLESKNGGGSKWSSRHRWETK